MTFDMKNFYLCTPLNPFEYVGLQLDYIPDEFITEHNIVHIGWIHFKICSVYGLPN